jgi:hypothetical protein
MDYNKAPSWLRIASMTAAVVVPALLLALGITWMSGFRDWTHERESRNAGFVMNGKVHDEGVVETIDRKLGNNEPEVIVLGNSLSNTNLNTAVLARRLGVASHKVQKFSIPNSIGAHWYVILKNRLYANGHQPRLVLILSDLQSTLATTPRTEAAYVNLTVHYGDDEPVVQDKIGSRNFFWESARQNREKLQERCLRYLRNLAVDLLYWRDLNADHGKTSTMLQRAFAQSNTDVALHNNVIPIFDNERQAQAFDPASLPSPGGSFIEEITSLVDENRGTVLFLRPPMSPLLPKGAGDVVLDGVEEEVRDMVAYEGGHYIDMRRLGMKVGHFYNIDHMNTEGARRFTESVAQLIRDIEGTQRYSRKMKRGRPQANTVELFAGIELVDDVLMPKLRPVEYQNEPKPVPGGQRNPQRKRENVGLFSTEGLNFLSDPETVRRSRFADRCSPLRVLEDGVPLPEHNVPCEELLELGQGRVCHIRDKLMFAPEDNTSPVTNGRKYTLALDPDRSCEAGTWLYPGDRVRFPIRTQDLDALARGARTLKIEAHDLGGPDGDDTMKVRLRVRGAVRAETSFQPAQQRGTLTLPLRPTIQANADDVVLSIINPSNHFFLITSALLSERAAPKKKEP